MGDEREGISSAPSSRPPPPACVQRDKFDQGEKRALLGKEGRGGGKTGGEETGQTRRKGVEEEEELLKISIKAIRIGETFFYLLPLRSSLVQLFSFVRSSILHPPFPPNFNSTFSSLVGF